MVDEKTFKRAYEMLMNGEYGSEEIASAATTRWIESILVIVSKEGKGKWGFDLIPSGKEEHSIAANGVEMGKKRVAVEEVKPVNMLGGGLVRKKPKT